MYRKSLLFSGTVVVGIVGAGHSSVMAARSAAAGGGGGVEGVVYQTAASSGAYTPFTSTTPAGTRFGDSGWLDAAGDAAPRTIQSISLGLATSAATVDVPAGSADLLFTFTAGDASGQVFGTGQTLYSTTLRDVALPAASAGAGASLFSIDIPLPDGVTLDGGFNNFGFTIGVERMSYAGAFGFQNSADAANPLGFATNRASRFDPDSGSWDLFSVGGDNASSITNFSAMLSTIPEPATLSLAAAALVSLLPRRRRRD